MSVSHLLSPHPVLNYSLHPIIIVICSIHLYIEKKYYTTTILLKKIYESVIFELISEGQVGNRSLGISRVKERSLFSS